MYQMSGFSFPGGLNSVDDLSGSCARNSEHIAVKIQVFTYLYGIYAAACGPE